jgi:P-type Cu2+ transporter
VDTVIFDKTGTLTTGQSGLIAAADADQHARGLAASLAAHSRHPYSRALTLLDDRTIAFDAVFEHPGLGLEGQAGSLVYRLGRPDWCLASPSSHREEAETVVLSANGKRLTGFRMDDELRPGAHTALADLSGLGLGTAVVSGDTARRVHKIAAGLGVTYIAGAQPADKVRYIGELKASGKKVLMVGDGLNDAPALARADVSMAPATAADVGRNAADIVFLREGLDAVPRAIEISRRANALVRQNFGLAIVYNVVAVPVAVLGHVTPLIAAIAMSLSSILVVANAMRLDDGVQTRLTRARFAANRAATTVAARPRQ